MASGLPSGLRRSMEVAGLIGNTPLVRIQSLSELTGCEVVSWACPHVRTCTGRLLLGITVLAAALW